MKTPPQPWQPKSSLICSNRASDSGSNNRSSRSGHRPNRGQYPTQFVGFLALHYALVGTLLEGIDPNSSAFRLQVLQAHAVGDWAGWTGIALFALGLIALGSALVAEGRALATAWAAIGVALIGVILIPTGFGFAFTLVLPVWEVIAAVQLLRRRPAEVSAV